MHRLLGKSINGEPRKRARPSSARRFSVSQAENEEPQPQVLFVLGFENLNPEPCRPST